MTTTSRAHAFTGSRTRIHTPPRRLEMHASATLSRARLPVGVFSRCVCFFEATSKKLSDSTLLGPLGVGRVASTAFYSFFSPSLPPSFSEPRSSRSSSSSSRSCRDPGFIILSRCGSIWIDFGGAVHRVTRWMTQKERAIRRERWSRHFPEEKKRKRKIKNPPPLPFFFWFFWGGGRRRRRSLFDFFFWCLRQNDSSDFEDLLSNRRRGLEKRLLGRP